MMQKIMITQFPFFRKRLIRATLLHKTSWEIAIYLAGV